MIGVLDLQGGVVEHLEHLERLHIHARRIKTMADLQGLTGLILPGGESTCLSRLLRLSGLDEGIRHHARHGMKCWGTCAGAILLAKEIEAECAHLGLIDISVQRNAFGSQLDSFLATAEVPEVSDEPLPLVFIRSPVISRVGPGVHVLLTVRGHIAAAESAEVLVTVFHPELSPSLAFHAYFAHKCGLASEAGTRPAHASDWHLTSWTRLAPIP